jgi:serine/threonine protein kinase
MKRVPMNDAKPDAKAVFLEALENPSPDDMASYLDEACAGDDALRRRVEELLQAHREAGNFLGPDSIQTAAPAEPVCERPGAHIGPYKLLQEIGEGGFGVVFLAEQEQPVRRRVALKVIKPGMDTRQVIARFEAERQALALMDHPHIAKVFDAGTTEHGRPYFVMELVHGVPVTEYCDQCNLTTRERLELFLAVSQAVQHAHQKGVIHRDIKPTNVLVAIQDGRPAPKIIDFGVAKAINQRLTENSLATGFAQIIGTPLYMSPEQAELSALGVDTRTDIYSLGVLLYELLAGATPFEKERLQAAPFDELRRIIRDEEPPHPSVRVSTLAADLASTVAQRRRTEPRRLTQQVRGELDWIVMKCLEKDRNRRYETANNLALDVQHYLHDEPVRACPPSAAYRLRKFARRNRVTLLTVGMIAMTLVVATVLSIWLALRAIEAERLAEDRLKAESLAHQQAEVSFQKARQVVDDMYTQVAERWLAQQPQMEPLQREFLEKALQFYTESAQRTSTDPTVRFETARAYRRMAEIQHRLGQPGEAETAFRRAAERLQSLVDESPQEPKYHSELADTLHQLGVLLGDTGRYADEEQTHRRALALVEQLVTEFPTVPDYRRDLGRAHWFVGQVLAHLHRREEAEKALRSALAIQNALAAEFPSVPEYRHHLAQTYLRLGLTLGYLGRFEEHREALGKAADILEALAAEFPTLPAYRNELANVYYWSVNLRRKGKIPLEEIEQYLGRALALQERLVAEYPSVTDYRYDWFRSHKTLGRLMTDADRTEEAETVFRQAATIAETLIAEAPTVHYYRGGLAYVQLSLGELFAKTARLDDAEAAYRDAIRILNALIAEFPDVPGYRAHLAETYIKLASVLTAAGRTETAAEANREALRLNPGGGVPLQEAAESLGDETDERPPKLNSQKGEIDR